VTSTYPGEPHGEDREPHEGPRITDRRRIDPETYQVREPATPAPVPSGDPGADALAQAETIVAEESRVAELTDDLRRVHAEYANYRKRVDRDRDLVRDTAVGGVLAELLPILDDLDRAREHGEFEGAFRTVGESLEATVTRLGLERFGAVGEEFDPAVHEALTHEQREGLTGPTVVALYQPGYRHAGRVLRAARVGVADA
jgi:molecular chaperone GrpE